MQKYDLPNPQAIFEINYFKARPSAFYHLARELFPGTFAPTPTHYFIRLLHEKGLLLRCFTQNIDSLETLAGLPEDKMVAAHGIFYHSRPAEPSALPSPRARCMAFRPLASAGTA